MPENAFRWIIHTFSGGGGLKQRFWGIVLAVVVSVAFCRPVWALSYRGHKEDAIAQTNDLCGNAGLFLHWIAFKKDRKKYKELTPEERERFERWKSMPPEKRRRLREKMDKFERMSPEERERYEQRLKDLQKLPPKERRKVKRKIKQWDTLPSDERNSLRNMFR
jgi:phage-related protein